MNSRPKEGQDRSTNWLRQHRKAVTSTQDLRTRGWIGELTKEELDDLRSSLDIRVPTHVHETHDLLEIENSDLANQFLPSRQELLVQPEEFEDPIGDEDNTPTPGLTHRYPDRVLLKLTHHCASYCRFCFRRYKVSHPDTVLSPEDEIRALAYIQSHPEIKEVILTGGDPLSLTTKTLVRNLEFLSQCPHIEMVRIHTRVPCVLPERLDDEVLLSRLESLADTRGVWVVLHINSAKELTPKAKQALKKLRRSGVSLLSQSVLLKGVNESKNQLKHLFQSLGQLGIKPYYLHYPDLARGTHHFRIPLSQALDLHSSLRGQLSGHCIPELVIDIPGGHGKVPATSDWIRQRSETHWEFFSPISKEWVSVQYPSS